MTSASLRVFPNKCHVLVTRLPCTCINRPSSLPTCFTSALITSLACRTRVFSAAMERHSAGVGCIQAPGRTKKRRPLEPPRKSIMKQITRVGALSDAPSVHIRSIKRVLKIVQVITPQKSSRQKLLLNQSGPPL